MKRFLEYALVLLIAIGAIVAVAYGLIASMTGKERARAEAKLSEQVVNALGENALEGVTGDWDEYEEAREKAVAARAEEAPASVRELRVRWKAILEPLVVKYPSTKGGDFAKETDVERIENGIQSRSADLDTLTPEDLAALGAFIAQYAETLQEILALSSPEGLSALEGLIRDSDALDGGVHSEYTGPLLRCEDLVATAGLTLLARGEYAPAVDHILAGLKLSDLQPSQEPGNTFGGMDLVEGLLCAGVNEALRKVHPGGEFPLEAAQAIVDQLGEGPDREVFAKQVAKLARIHVRYLSFYPWNQFSDAGFSRLFSVVYENAASPLIDRDVRLYTDAITRFMDLAPLPYYEAAPQLAEIRLVPSTWRPHRSGMMWGFEAIREDGFPDQAWREVRLDMARMGLLLARHHMEHGTYPPSLAAIAEQLEGGIPIDPFSGKPYRYVLNDEGCLLYSVGRNQIDDGGVPGRAAGDILWRQRWALPEPVEEEDAWARHLLDILG